MLVAPSGERLLVELKFVDRAWPLVGAAGSPAERWATPWRTPRSPSACWPNRWSSTASACAPATPSVSATRASPSRGALSAEPDRVATPLLLGPRVLIADALASTGLIAPGSMVHYAIRATLPDASGTRAVLAGIRRDFPAKAGACASRVTRPPVSPASSTGPPVHDPGRTDLSAGRRHRGRQRRRAWPMPGRAPSRLCAVSAPPPGWCSPSA